jgi:hypothetical protein
MKDNGILRMSESGAIRNSDVGKINYQGALSPLILEAYGKYIEKHSLLPDGTRRNNKNWQKLFGTPEEHRQVCIESAWRHFIDVLMEHDGYDSRDGIDEALGGLMFNVQAYWFSLLIERKKKNE